MLLHSGDSGAKLSTGGSVPLKSIRPTLPRITIWPSRTNTKGELDKARAAYEKAVELEPGNSFIKQNYELFKEINDRTTRQDNQ